MGSSGCGLHIRKPRLDRLMQISWWNKIFESCCEIELGPLSWKEQVKFGTWTPCRPCSQPLLRMLRFGVVDNWFLLWWQLENSRKADVRLKEPRGPQHHKTDFRRTALQLPGCCQQILSTLNRVSQAALEEEMPEPDCYRLTSLRGHSLR